MLACSRQASSNQDTVATARQVDRARQLHLARQVTRARGKAGRLNRAWRVAKAQPPVRAWLPTQPSTSSRSSLVTAMVHLHLHLHLQRHPSMKWCTSTRPIPTLWSHFPTQPTVTTMPGMARTWRVVPRTWWQCKRLTATPRQSQGPRLSLCLHSWLSSLRYKPLGTSRKLGT